jgi:hypothetical protein
MGFEDNKRCLRRSVAHKGSATREVQLGPAAAVLKPNPLTGVSLKTGEGMPGKWNQAMREQIQELRLPNTLELPPSHTAAIVGHLLKKVYADALREDHPRHLMDLIERLDHAEGRLMRSSER